MKDDYLSHYTNVDTLEIILRDKTIKLNKLKWMNDKNEGRNLENVKTQEIMYSSSWTEDKSLDGIDEMWEKYTKYGSGIRITTERYPFKKYDFKGDNIKNESGNKMRTYLNPKRYIGLVDSTVIANSINKYKMLKQVVYTDDKTKYMLYVVEQDWNFTNVKILELGVYKEAKWKNELEWRYLITIMNRGVFNPFFKGLNMKEQIYVMGEINPKEIFLDLKSSSIRKMEVIMSKNITNENRKKLYELSKQYNFKII